MSALRVIRNDRRFVATDLLGAAPEWRERALCSQTDPEAFYPDKGESNLPAKRICRQCDVKTECLEYALNRGEQFGIWGGQSEKERRTEARRRAGRTEVAA